MPVFNIGEFLSNLFTWCKLGVSLTVLVILMAKFVEVWQDTMNPETKGQQPDPTIVYRNDG